MKFNIKHVFQGIFTKFVIAFIVMGFVPIMGMSYVFFNKLPETIEQYMISNYEQTLLVASKNLEIKYKEYNELSKSIYTFNSNDYSMLKAIISDEDFKYSSLDKQRIYTNFLNGIMYSDEYIVNVYMLNGNRELIDFVSRNRSFYIQNKSEGLIYDEIIYNNPRLLKMIPTHPDKYFFESDKILITFVRNYLDLDVLPQRESILGTIFIDVDITFFDMIISQLDIKEKGNVFVIDNAGNHLYNPAQIDTDPAKELYNNFCIENIDKESGYILIDNKFTFFRNVEGTDWVIFYEIAQNNVIHVIQSLQRWNLFFLVIIGGMLIIVAFVFSRELAKPVKSMMKQMKKIESGDLNTKIKIKASYEMKQLANAFNNMTSRLSEYIREVYFARIKQNEAELNAIKSQIRPHYLYNTLEVIRMNAILEDADSTQEMIYSLSLQLKYLIGDTNDKVSINDELEMIENYFKIIDVSFKQRISLEIDAADHIRKYRIQKLLIQPIVENSVVHGLKPKKGKGKVKVSIEEKDNTLIIKVIDDGIGIQDDDIKRMNGVLESEDVDETDSSSQNIGIKNVHDRIQLAYGRQYGIRVNSRINMGTLVEITIPIEEDKYNENE